jgi:hypothetical protein
MLSCTNCRLEMRVKKNGYEYVEMWNGRDLKLWSSDLWECKGCGAQIAFTSTSQQPILREHEPRFKERSGTAPRIETKLDALV